MKSDATTTRLLSPNDRRISVGGTTVELSQDEVRLGLVSYTYRTRPDHPPEVRWAPPAKVLSSAAPLHHFQVDDDGFRVLYAKALRLKMLKSRRVMM